MKTFLAIILLTACTKTQIVQAPLAPKPPTNHADDLVQLVKPFKDQGITCKPWTGIGTQFAGIDSYLCQTPTSLTWCAAPKDGPPRCVTALDWTPAKPAEPTPAPTPVVVPPKPPVKK